MLLDLEYDSFHLHWFLSIDLCFIIASLHDHSLFLFDGGDRHFLVIAWSWNLILVIKWSLLGANNASSVKQSGSLNVVTSWTWDFIVFEEGPDSFCELSALDDVSRFWYFVSSRTGIDFLLLWFLLTGEKFLSFGEGKFVFMGKTFAGLVLPWSRNYLLLLLGC